jgi:hypothetical protein
VKLQEIASRFGVKYKRIQKLVKDNHKRYAAVKVKTKTKLGLIGAAPHWEVPESHLGLLAQDLGVEGGVR